MRKVVIIDDLDKTSEAVETLPIFFEGWTYVLDLSAANAELVRDTLKPLLDAAHDKYRGHTPPKSRAKPATPSAAETVDIGPSTPKPKPTRYSALAREERDALREWARANGYEVGKGHLANAVIDAWQQAEGAA